MTPSPSDGTIKVGKEDVLTPDHFGGKNLPERGSGYRPKPPRKVPGFFVKSLLYCSSVGTDDREPVGSPWGPTVPTPTMKEDVKDGNKGLGEGP